MLLSRAPHSSASIVLPFMSTSLAESLGLGRDTSFSRTVHRTKTPDDLRMGTSFVDAYSPPTIAPGRKKGEPDPSRETQGVVLRVFPDSRMERNLAHLLIHTTQISLGDFYSGCPDATGRWADTYR